MIPPGRNGGPRVRGAARKSADGAPRAALAVAVVLIASSPGGAQDAPAAAPAAQPNRTVMFGGLDWGRSGFAAFGAKHSLFGPLDRDGPALMGSIGYGGEFERVGPPGTPLALRHTFLAGALAGYQWMMPWGALGAFVGPELASEIYREWENRDRRSRTRFGARMQGEVWAHPTENTLLTSTVVLGSARRSAWGRLALGYRLWGRAFVGPEIAGYATETYRKAQVGLHVTGVELGGFALRLSGGAQWERERRLGPYIGLSGHFGL